MAGLVAIHQPNFFPWMGYFDKIRRADTFVFLDAVDYPRKGSGSMGSWVNRVSLAINGEPRWITCPVQRMPLGAPIRDAVIDDNQPWRLKLLNSLAAAYGRAPNYRAGRALLEPLVLFAETNLSAFNMNAITKIAEALEVGATFVRQSALQADGKATMLLCNLVKSTGGRAYLAGGGASGYQDDALFAAQGLDLVYQNFTPKLYGDPSRWHPGLSVIDYLMHDGRPIAEAFPECEDIRA